ncbi:hypothetical protein B0H10DRAFT_1938700 [Mycena sp. CBHHK59/15]|nr:hypothetical protein B0H10DRAFT_1938700 [Mycena sp. CBHHK59/15]
MTTSTRTKKKIWGWEWGCRLGNVLHLERERLGVDNCEQLQLHCGSGDGNSPKIRAQISAGFDVSFPETVTKTQGPHRNHENAHPSGLEVAVMRVPEYHVATAPPSQARSRISVANAEHDGLHQTARLCNCAARSKYPIYGGALRVFDIFWVEPGPQRAAEDCDSGRDVETSKRPWWKKIDRPSGLSGACLGERWRLRSRLRPLTGRYPHSRPFQKAVRRAGYQSGFRRIRGFPPEKKTSLNLVRCPESHR